MEDMKRRLKRLRDDAAECAIISGLAETKEKRELFTRLAETLNALADDVEQTMTATYRSATFLGRKSYEPFPKQEEE